MPVKIIFNYQVIKIPVKRSLINVYGIEFRFKTPVFPLKTFCKKWQRPAIAFFHRHACPSQLQLFQISKKKFQSKIYL